MGTSGMAVRVTGALATVGSFSARSQEPRSRPVRRQAAELRGPIQVDVTTRACAERRGAWVLPQHFACYTKGLISAEGAPPSPGILPGRTRKPMESIDPAARPVLVLDFGAQYVQLIARRVR